MFLHYRNTWNLRVQHMMLTGGVGLGRTGLVLDWNAPNFCILHLTPASGKEIKIYKYTLLQKHSKFVGFVSLVIYKFKSSQKPLAFVSFVPNGKVRICT